VIADAPPIDAMSMDAAPDAAPDATPDVMAVDTFVPPDPATIEPPRALAPLSGALSSTHSPVVRWTFGSSATTGARVELCEDRDCMRPIDNVAVAAGATQATLTIAPTRRRVFWRLRGLVAGAPGARTSAPWLLNINPTPTPRARYQRSMLDVNNDGLADVLVGVVGGIQLGRMNAGRTTLHFGTAAAPGINTTSDTAFDINGSWDNMRGPNELGASVAIVGDMNGDGFAEMLAGSPCGPYNDTTMMCGAGRARIEFGRATGPATQSASFVGTTGGSRFGTSVAGLADFNGDGLADAAIGAPLGGTFGELWLVRGTATGTPTMGLGPAPSEMSLSRYGTAVASAGDVNGDGLTDIIVGAPNSQGLTGRAHLVFGNASWVSGPPPMTLVAVRLPSPTLMGASMFGAAVSSAGDVNGDGFADVIVGAPGNSRAFIYLGRADAATAMTWDMLTLSGPAEAAQRFGSALSGVGDLNGDGFDDLAIGGASTTDMIDTPVRVYMGGPMGLAGARPEVGFVTLNPVPAMTINSTTGKFGSAVAGGGDLNGDGFADLVVGAPLAPAFADPMSGTWITIGGRVLVYFGSATGFGSAPPVVLSTTSGPGTRFGGSLS
jgi:hypothetical protein